LKVGKVEVVMEREKKIRDCTRLQVDEQGSQTRRGAREGCSEMIKVKVMGRMDRGWESSQVMEARREEEMFQEQKRRPAVGGHGTGLKWPPAVTYSSIPWWCRTLWDGVVWCGVVWTCGGGDRREELGRLG
jgi:hypothetical protein